MFRKTQTPYICFIIFESIYSDLEEITLKYEVNNYAVPIQKICENDCATLFFGNFIDLIPYDCPKILAYLLEKVSIQSHIDHIYIYNKPVHEQISELFNFKCKLGHYASIIVLHKYTPVADSNLSEVIYSGNIECINFLINLIKPSYTDSFIIFKNAFISNNYNTIVYLINLGYTLSVLSVQYLKCNRINLYSRLKKNNYLLDIHDK